MGDITWPAIHKSDLLIALAWLVTQLVSMGVIDSDQSQVLLQVGSSFIAFAWLFGQAITRKGRNEVIAAKVAGDPSKALPKQKLIG